MSRHFHLKDFLSNISNFRIVFIVETLFFSVFVLDVVAIVANVFTFVWGVYLFVKNGVVQKKVVKVKFFRIITLFILSNVVTTVLQVRHNFWVNLAYVFYMLLVFFLFYGAHSLDDFNTIQNEIVVVFKTTILINTVLVIISLLTILIPRNIILTLPYEIGIYRGERLTGIYSNPNLLGFYSAVVVFMNFSLMGKKSKDSDKKFFPIWFSVLSVMLNLLALFLSDSNSSFLFLVIYITVFIFCKIFNVFTTFNVIKIAVRSVMLLAICVGLIAVYFVARKSCQTIINETVNEIYQSEDIDNQYSDEEGQSENQHVSIGRRLGSSKYKDVSNGRIDLIKQGIQIFLRHPVMGIGRGNLVYYGDLYFENGLRFPDLHNGYLTVLVSSGIVGFTLFFIFGVGVARDLFSYMFKNGEGKTSSVYYHILSAICGYCVYSLFEKTILTEMTFMVLFFWSMLGYAMSYVVKSETDEILVLGDDKNERRFFKGGSSYTRTKGSGLQI